MNSWDKSDSHICLAEWGMDCAMVENGHEPATECRNGDFYYCVGENDLKLMKNLSKAGSDHSKYLRMINVTFDLTAPLYFLKEWDTYKVSTVSNSCSTMHKIHENVFTLDDFSHEHLLNDIEGFPEEWYLETFINLVGSLNYAREAYLKTKDKKYWWQMIQLLPSSYNQKRTVQLNYQVLKNMYHARKNHKLDEWRDFCKWCETLPYFREICIEP